MNKKIYYGWGWRAPVWGAVLGCLSQCLLSMGGELKAGYFDATPIGSWARYLSTSKDGTKIGYTYKRLPDEKGQARLEIETRILAGPGAGSTYKNLYVMLPGFDFSKDSLSYGKYVDRLSMQFGDAAPMPQSPEMIKMIRDSGNDFRGAVSFEAKEQKDGHSCDRYATAARSGGVAPSVTRGSLWLDASVPFAIVHQVGKVVQVDGTVLTDYEMVLEESGKSEGPAVIAAAVASSEPAVPGGTQTNTIASAYKEGKVGFRVTVMEGSAGRRLGLMVLNKGESDLVVAIVPGDQDFEAGSPVNQFKVTFKEGRTLMIPAGDASEPLEVLQRGTRGAQEGTFSISVYEGTPLCSGSVTIGPLVTP